ncbi:MAG: rane protein [Bacilli bacterium]|nr:rane protein [Bacilli bacterium]
MKLLCKRQKQPNSLLTSAAIGLVASSLVAWAAYWKRSLNGSGALAAIVVGTLLYAFGSAFWYSCLLAFFISSSLLSKWRHKNKAEIEQKNEKTGRRDAGQVLANGGVATLICLLQFSHPAPYWWIAFAGVLATVNADTWATEIGTAVHGRPRSVLTWKLVEPGSSGGVSIAGSLAAALGAMFIGVIGVLACSLARTPGTPTWLTSADLQCLGALASITVGGLVGCYADSLLGASLQALYRCRVCGIVLEKSIHHDQQCELIKGFTFLTNDAVNCVSSIIGGLITILAAMALHLPIFS